MVSGPEPSPTTRADSAATARPPAANRNEPTAAMARPIWRKRIGPVRRLMAPPPRVETMAAR